MTEEYLFSNPEKEIQKIQMVFAIPLITLLFFFFILNVFFLFASESAREFLV